MFVKLFADCRVVLEEPDNFRAFKLVVVGERTDWETLRAPLRGIADLEDADTGWVDVAWLRAQRGAGDAAWQQSFDAMIAKARPHGWIDDARNAVKAHVEWVAA